MTKNSNTKKEPVKKALIITAYIVSAFVGVYLYTAFYPKQPNNDLLAQSQLAPTINNNKPPKPRWYKPLGSNPSWQYGIIPEPGFDGDAEIYEVSDIDPTVPISAIDKTVAKTFRQEVIDIAYRNRWDDVNQALADGYSNAPPFDFLHYVNINYTHDGHVLNPEKPEFLMYYPSSKGLVLAGAMFLTEAFYDHGPQPGGSDMIWHYHTADEEYCFRNNVMVEFESDNQCVNGIASRRSPEMLHIWFVEHPDGPYATDMCLPAGVIEGWEGRKTWEAERLKRFDEHIRILREKRFTLQES